MTDQTYVYLIARHSDEFGYPVKIGITSNLWARLSTVRTYAPFGVEYFDEICVPSRAIALEIEGSLHKGYARERLKGEWFNLPPTPVGLQLILTYIEIMKKHGFDDSYLDDDPHNNLWLKVSRYERLMDEHLGRMGTYAI